MKKAENIIIGDFYTVSTGHRHCVKIIAQKDDFFLVEHFSFQDKPATMANSLIHKSLIYEEPTSWMDLPIEYLLEILYSRFKWDSATGNLLHDRFRIGSDTKNQPAYPDLVKDAFTKSTLEILLAIIPQCDYTTIHQIQYIFVHEIHYMDQGVIKSNIDILPEFANMQELKEAIPPIKERHRLMDDDMNWRKHLSINKVDHFLYHLNDILTNKTHYSMTLFPEYDTQCFNALGFASKSMNVNDMSLEDLALAMNKTTTVSITIKDDAFSAVIKFLMNNGLYCDKDGFHNKLAVPDFVNPDYTNRRYLTVSANKSGFGYIMYITGKELKSIYTELYGQRVRSRNVNKPVWGFILGSDDDTKFYILIQ